MSVIAATAPRTAVRRASRRLKPARVILHAFLIAMVALWLFPLFWAVFASLRPYGDTVLHGYLSWPANGLSFINNAFGLVKSGNIIDWLGNPRINLFAILIATSWRHIGYIMILYLAGLKSVDPSLREAARVDGATEVQTFFRVVLPVMAPINVIIVVVTAIEALRAFDIAFIINQGKNGLELLSILITNNSISEASLVGFGSAIAVVLLLISLVPIVAFLSRVMRTLA